MTSSILNIYSYIENLVLWASQSKMARPWSFVSKNTNSKHQITNKFQIPIFNDKNRIKKRTSNIELRTSNVELGHALGVSILLKKRSEMFDVYLFPVCYFEFWSL